MGIYDLDYYREGPTPSRVGQLSMLTVTTWLIIANVAVFFLDEFLYRAFQLVYVEPIPGQATLFITPLYGLGYFSIAKMAHFEIWRILSFQFLHANIQHLLFNMLALYFFGPLVESYLGRRRFLSFYLLCGIGGPIAYTILWGSHVLIASSWVQLVGASAGIFGVLIAGAKLAPNATVLIYGIIPMKLKTLAWLLLGVAVYVVLSYGRSAAHNAGGEAAHLGGAAVGWLLINNPQLLAWPRFRGRPPF